ncbi:MAG: ACT domain-containing protein [Pseudomonadota bacterium]
MSGVTDLDTLIATLRPELLAGEFVFVTLDGDYGDGAALHPIAACREDEGLSLIVPRASAVSAGLAFDGVFRMISLRVHSSLDAVGLTAAIATRLGEVGIPANVVAARYHDHVFVPADRADDALQSLTTLT